MLTYAEAACINRYANIGMLCVLGMRKRPQGVLLVPLTNSSSSLLVYYCCDRSSAGFLGLVVREEELAQRIIHVQRFVQLRHPHLRLV